MDIKAFRNGQLAFQTSRDFVASVSNHCFKIEARFNRTTNRMIYSFDGQSLYKVFISPAVNLDGSTNPVPHMGSDFAAYIYPSPMPIPDDGSYIDFIWLPYASTYFFQSLTNEMVAPLWPVGPTPEQARDRNFIAKYHTNADIFGLPKEVIYIHPSGTNSEPAFTNAIFKVLSATNIEQASITTEFNFTRYSDTGSMGIVLEAHGYATNITVKLSARTILPEFTGIASVYDYRTKGHFKLSTGADKPYEYISYNITDGQWISTDPAVMESLRASYEKRLQKISDDMNVGRVPRLITPRPPEPPDIR